jgi:FkbH-like protein
MKSKDPNSYIEGGIEFINGHAQGNPIILHTDAGVIAHNLKKEAMKRQEMLADFINSLQRSCTSSSIFIPTFDYEYCSTRRYNPEDGKSQLGGISKYCANRFKSYRTLVPVFNHADIKERHEPINDLYRLDKAFGEESFYDWFTEQDGYIFFWGCRFEVSNTYIHHVEQLSQVCYRYKKLFQGRVYSKQSPIDLAFDFNVRPGDFEISYLDLGRSIASETDNLLIDKVYNIEGYSAKQFISKASPILNRDEFALLSNESRLAISKYLSDHSSLREITEDKRIIQLLSDSTLDLLTRGWNSNRFSFKAVYCSSLILELERLSKVESLDCSALLIMPSPDSFSIGMLDVSPCNTEDIGIIVEKSLMALVGRIKELHQKHPATKIIYISPFDNYVIKQLSDSQESACTLSEIFARLDRITFEEFDALGICFEKALGGQANNENITYSFLNYLRYRYPYDMRSTKTLRSQLTAIVNKQFLVSNEIKVISVDLDNTLWRGVAGDEGIEISKDFPSNSSLLLQKVLKQLRGRGVFLTITSKNDYATVEEIFKKSRNKMILEMKDFSCIEANWGKKSYSLARQSSMLNIGLDSFLHIDDSDLELSEIMSSHPKVETLKFVPEEIDSIINFLLSHPRSSKASLTASDRTRTFSLNLLDQSLTAPPQSRAEDNSYLESLQISLNVSRGGEESFDFKRSCQLLAKTNQFNTSQKTYESIAGRTGFSLDMFNLLYIDKNGIQECCSVICAEHQNKHNELVISSFVLSCRFFARGLEYYFLKKVWNSYQAGRLSILFAKNKKNTPAFEFVMNIATDSGRHLLAQSLASRSLKISIDIDELELQCAKFEKYYKRTDNDRL